MTSIGSIKGGSETGGIQNRTSQDVDLRVSPNLTAPGFAMQTWNEHGTRLIELLDARNSIEQETMPSREINETLVSVLGDFPTSNMKTIRKCAALQRLNDEITSVLLGLEKLSEKSQATKSDLSVIMKAFYKTSTWREEISFIKATPQSFPSIYLYLKNRNSEPPRWLEELISKGLYSFTNFALRHPDKISDKLLDEFSRKIKGDPYEREIKEAIDLIKVSRLSSGEIYRHMSDNDLLKSSSYFSIWMDKLIKENAIDTAVKEGQLNFLDLANEHPLLDKITDTLEAYIRSVNSETLQDTKERVRNAVRDLCQRDLSEYESAMFNKKLVPANVDKYADDPELKSDIKLILAQVKVDDARNFQLDLPQLSLDYQTNRAIEEGKISSNIGSFAFSFSMLWLARLLVLPIINIVIMPFLRPLLANHALEQLKNNLLETIKDKTEIYQLSTEEIRIYAHLIAGGVKFEGKDQEKGELLKQALEEDTEIAQETQKIRAVVARQIIENRVALCIPILGTVLVVLASKIFPQTVTRDSGNISDLS